MNEEIKRNGKKFLKMFPISIFKRCRANQSFDPVHLTFISITKVLSGHPVTRSLVYLVDEELGFQKESFVSQGIEELDFGIKVVCSIKRWSEWTRKKIKGWWLVYYFKTDDLGIEWRVISKWRETNPANGGRSRTDKQHHCRT